MYECFANLFCLCCRLFYRGIDRYVAVMQRVRVNTCVIVPRSPSACATSFTLFNKTKFPFDELFCRIWFNPITHWKFIRSSVYLTVYVSVNFPTTLIYLLTYLTGTLIYLKLNVQLFDSCNYPRVTNSRELQLPESYKS